MTYILFQLGMLFGFLACRQLDEALVNLRLFKWHTKLGPIVAAVVATAGPGFAHLLLGRFLTAAYTVAMLVTALGVIPVPYQLSSIPFGLTLIPLWLLNIADAWRTGRRVLLTR